MSWGWNNGNNKWIKGKFADIETSPHGSQPGACIKILQQDTRGNASAVFENLILHSHTFRDGARRLRHVEKFINHQPAVVELRVTDKDSVQMMNRSPGVSVCCHRTTWCPSSCACVSGPTFNPSPHCEGLDSWWHSATLLKHGTTHQQGHAAAATSRQMAVIPLTSVSGCPCCKINFPSRP